MLLINLALSFLLPSLVLIIFSDFSSALILDRIGFSIIFMSGLTVPSYKPPTTRNCTLYLISGGRFVMHNSIGQSWSPILEI